MVLFMTMDAFKTNPSSNRYIHGSIQSWTLKMSMYLVGQFLTLERLVEMRLSNPNPIQNQNQTKPIGFGLVLVPLSENILVLDWIGSKCLVPCLDWFVNFPFGLDFRENNQTKLAFFAHFISIWFGFTD